RGPPLCRPARVPRGATDRHHRRASPCCRRSPRRRGHRRRRRLAGRHGGARRRRRCPRGRPRDQPGEGSGGPHGRTGGARARRRVHGRRPFVPTRAAHRVAGPCRGRVGRGRREPGARRDRDRRRCRCGPDPEHARVQPADAPRPRVAPSRHAVRAQGLQRRCSPGAVRPGAHRRVRVRRRAAPHCGHAPPERARGPRPRVELGDLDGAPGPRFLPHGPRRPPCPAVVPRPRVLGGARGGPATGRIGHGRRRPRPKYGPSMPAPLRFGVFLAPFHPVPHNPTLSLEHDLQAIEALERLGFDEVWVGEHHSGGLEIISSPEVFIAAAAQRTRRIRLGTGVSSLPYHHPFMLADRMVLLDHLTRGRAMLGCGPGQLVSDAVMMGIDPDEQRRMLGEGLDAIMALLRADAPVTMETDWFTLRDARLQLAPFTYPHMEVAVAGSFSPAGPSHAGRNGVGLISIGATSPQGFALLASHWEVYETEAAAHGHTADRSRWRLVAPMLLADTDEEARRAVRYGYPQITGYL